MRDPLTNPCAGDVVRWTRHGDDVYIFVCLVLQVDRGMVSTSRVELPDEGGSQDMMSESEWANWNGCLDVAVLHTEDGAHLDRAEVNDG